MAYNFTVNGTSLNDGTICRVARWSGILMSAPLRGSNTTVPGVVGARHRTKYRGAYVFSVPVVLIGSSLADFQDRLDDLKTLLYSPSAALTLTRTRPTGGGDVTETCQGDYVAGLEPELVNLQVGRVALEFENLSAVWT